MIESFTVRPTECVEFPPFVHYREAFTPAQCRDIIDAGRSRPMGPGMVGNGADGKHEVRLSTRSVHMRVLGPEGLSWLFSTIRDRVEWTNRDMFRFALSGFLEGIQFLEYQANKDGHYAWHQDFGGGPSSLRKLSIVVQLTDPAEYTGGSLELFTDQSFAAPSGRGDIIIFPSWTPHRVTPITSGVRHSLAAWVGGPQFR